MPRSIISVAEANREKIMDYKELLEKYQALLIENNNLKEEVKALKAQFNLINCQSASEIESDQEMTIDERNNQGESQINNQSDALEKIKLFKSLFRGREDVYARRWVFS